MIVVRVPLHVSGLWVPSLSGDPLASGSLGAGLVLDLWLEAEAERGPCGIELGGARVLERHSSMICGAEGVEVAVRAGAPAGLGKGFAVSGAASLALSMASWAIKRGVVCERSAWSAHAAEVANRTGLGDVMAQYLGGMVIRTRPGPPGLGEAVSVRPVEPMPLVAVELARAESTEAMLKRLRPEDYREALPLLERLYETLDPRDFFELSERFTRRLFDYSEADALLRGRRGVVGYYVKKAALVAWVERDWLLDVSEAVRGMGLTPLVTKVSERGAHVVRAAHAPEEREPPG